ncbi:LCP family protein [Salinicoccus kekensis]|uniref:LytR family transcriptional attenuator n=1 Tax=Salinicoccus kekensis TaxID=714307 RepID=A0A285UST4_9STAP|nr:LCP family protein [Salinicoccus kekensis]SOC44853.1 LytR family transcriptional attenuator [Salinicoccus kekensis]
MKKFLIILFSVLLVILIGVGVYIYSVFNTFEQGVSDSYEATDRERSELRIDEVDPNLDSFTVLILGVDESETRSESEDLDTGDFRTDTVILATFDKDEDDVKLVSIPRDTLTYFPDENYYDKITHAHRNGGPESSMLAVESLLNVPVDYYVRVSMPAVVDVVDALGGVEFDVPFDMESPTSIDRGTIEVEEGEQILDGEEALAVVRNRDVDTDLGRGNRQLEMVQAIMQRAKSTGALTKIDDLIEVVAENVRHDMTSETVRDLATYYAFNSIEFDNTQVVGTDFWYQPNGAYFYLADPEHLLAISNTLREILDLEPTEPNDLINLRLHGIYEPYQYLDDYLLEEFTPETAHAAHSDDYENPYGDGFDIPEFDHEDLGVEGEDDLEEENENGNGDNGNGNGNNGNGEDFQQVPVEPEYNEPYEEPAYEEPVYNEPAYEEPNYNDPGYNENEGFNEPAVDEFNQGYNDDYIEPDPYHNQNAAPAEGYY